MYQHVRPLCERAAIGVLPISGRGEVFKLYVLIYTRVVLASAATSTQRMQDVRSSHALRCDQHSSWSRDPQVGLEMGRAGPGYWASWVMKNIEP
jgi:hypothetical protein